MWTVQCTVYSLHCPVYTVYTIYIVLPISSNLCQHFLPRVMSPGHTPPYSTLLYWNWYCIVSVLIINCTVYCDDTRRHCTALHWNALNCTTLHCTEVNFTALQYWRGRRTLQMTQFQILIVNLSEYAYKVTITKRPSKCNSTIRFKFLNLWCNFQFIQSF